jgi:hypothetical protein
MILLYKMGSEVFLRIVEAVQQTLSPGHVNVKKVLSER